MRNSPTPCDPTGGLSLGPYGGPRRVEGSYERGTPAYDPVYDRLRIREVELAPCQGLGLRV
jgi:hypothetical protein